MMTHKQLTLAEVLKIVKINLTTTNISFFCFSFSRPNRKASQAPALSNAQSTSAPAYFLKPDGHAPDCVLEILSGTA